jgi:succinoglycan biosynthesis transport protein ExoP
MITDKSDHEIRGTTRGIAPGWGRMSRTAPGSQPAAERGSWSRVLLKHWSWILLMTAVVTAGASVLAEVMTPIYKAQAVVAVYPPSWAGSAVPIILGTEKGIISSGAVLSIASQSLLISESTLQRGLSISIPVDTDLLVISFSDPDPQVAQSVAEGIAQTYVTYRTSKAAPIATGNTSAAPSTAEALQAAVISDAALPTSPVSPQRLLIIGAAVILGLGLGIGMALIRDTMDDGLRGPLDLQTQADAPVLAQIPAFYRKKRSIADGLVILSNPSSTVAEAYRNLRTRVLQVAEWRHANVLLATSPSREDKATVAANLAAALALSGRRVVLVCADLRWGRTHALFGLDNRLGLTNLVNGDARLADALRWTEVSGLQVLPGGQAYFDPSSVLQSAAFRDLLDELRSKADFVVIDAPPVLASADTAALGELGAMMLLVADARASTRAEVRTAMRELGHVHDDMIGCVLDNVGRASRLPQASIAAAMRTINTNSYPGFTVAPNGNARPEPERDSGQAASATATHTP